MNDIFSNTQIPLPLNVPDDFCIDDSAHLFLQATRTNESPLADILESIEKREREELLTRRAFIGLKEND
ncbi:hypothetical protein [Limnobacter sp.]|uniref:hypothetical protein n=1 Tax=Limnobacter sp. TaxID=2003368 RepID=UPI0025C3E71A|nr:hypothetical protein [Limnobacter sp.]